MSFFFGKGPKTKPSYTGLQLQSSSSVQGITILWGRNRVGPNIIWYGDFTTHKKKQKAGKGGPKQTTYTYSASVQMALCEGPITGTGRVFKDDEKKTLSELGMSLFPGTYPQAPWGYLTTKHPEAALNYPGVAYVAVANYDLGTSASLGNHSFETYGINYDTAVTEGDSECAFIVVDSLTNPNYGAGFGIGRLDLDQIFSTGAAGTTGDPCYETYCRAMGFGLSPALSDPKDMGTILAQWANLTNSAIVWNGYKLKMVPYAREIIEGNGVKFVPVQLNAPVYELTDADFTDDPIADRIDPSDAPNIMVININNAANEYNQLPVEYRDQALIDQFGERKASSIDAPEVTDADCAGNMVALIAARAAYIRNKYKFSLGPEYVLLEPMDTVIAVLATGSRVLLQLTTIEESDDGILSCEADEIANGVSVGVQVGSPQAAIPDTVNQGQVASPVNTPIIFEPSAALTGGVAQVWAVVSGGAANVADPYWGGAIVYISTDDITYQAVGQIDSAGRQGITTSAMLVGTGTYPEATSVGVDLRRSLGELQSVTEDENASYSTLSYVGGELISYELATLTDTNRYTLNTLYRGLYGTTALTHASGVPFGRLDENVFKYDLPADYIGKELFLKFQSFNAFNSGYQDLADVVAYSYTPDGNGFKIAPPSSINLVFSINTQADGTSVLRGTITLGASSGPLLSRYDVEISQDNGATWSAVGAINAGATTTFFEPAIASTDYKARARSVSSAVENIPSAWVTTATVNSGPLSGGVEPDAPTDLTATPAPLANKLDWTEPGSGAYVQGYHIWGINALTGVFADAVKIGTVSGGTVTQWNHTALPGDDDWRYWVTAFNLAGDSPELGPENSTTQEAGGGGGSLSVDYEGTEIVATATVLNFTGDGVSVTDGGGGIAVIDIPGGSGGGSSSIDWSVQATGTGVSQDVTLPSNGLSNYQALVFVNGIRYETTEYTIVGNALTLTTNAAGDAIEILGPLLDVPEGTSTLWRVYCTDYNGGALVSISEMYLYTDTSPTDVAPTGTPTQSSQYNVFGPLNIIDRIYSTFSSLQLTGPLPGWWQIEFSTPKTIVGMGIMARASELNNAPKDFVLQYYNGTSWVDTTAVATGEVSWGYEEIRDFFI